MNKNLVFEGKVHKYGKNIDTDVIIPARYLNTTDLNELSSHCFEDLDSNFTKKVRKGDMLVAEENFGSGSSREQAPLAIKGSGISCIIAKSFARIFFRNAINSGLPILEAKEAVDKISDGEKLRVDLERGEIEKVDTGEKFQAQPFPPFLEKIIEKGGIINYIKSKS